MFTVNLKEFSGSFERCDIFDDNEIHVRVLNVYMEQIILFLCHHMIKDLRVIEPTAGSVCSLPLKLPLLQLLWLSVKIHEEKV